MRTTKISPEKNKTEKENKVKLIVLISITATQSGFISVNKSQIESHIDKSGPTLVGYNSRKKSVKSGTCKRVVTVATVDTGIDLNNKDLSKYLKRDSGGNVIGRSSVSDFESIQDRNGHGTHIASIIAESSPCIKIIPISYNALIDGKDVPIGSTMGIAIRMALNYGPDIINISGGGYGFSNEEFEAVSLANDRGVLIVAAAGNDSLNIDFNKNKYFPGSYKTDNIVVVGSVGPDNRYSTFSNYGSSVDIAAVGSGVTAMGLDNKMVTLSGTSQATAVVSGAIAGAMSVNPNLTPFLAKRALIESANLVEPLSSKVGSGRVLDVARLHKIASKVTKTHEEESFASIYKTSAKVERSASNF